MEGFQCETSVQEVLSLIKNSLTAIKNLTEVSYGGASFTEQVQVNAFVLLRVYF